MSLNLPKLSEKRDYVQEMFGRIANRYDLMNKIISCGLDSSWRKQVIKILQPESKKMYLDIGCGTGDLAQEIINIQPNANVIAADLTIQMIRVGKTKNKSPNICWIVADAELLPFPAETFDGVVSGYLIRNVSSQRKALTEQINVLLPGAKTVTLETTPPERNFFYPWINVYFRFVIPFIGRLVSGDKRAYTYLPISTKNHLPAEILAGIFKETGFKSVGYTKFMFGTMAIHNGEKPVEENMECTK